MVAENGSDNTWYVDNRATPNTCHTTKSPL